MPTRDFPADGLPMSDAEQALLDTGPLADRQSRADALEQQLASLPECTSTDQADSELALTRATFMLELAGLRLDLGDQPAAHALARDSVAPFLAHARHEDAAMACQYAYLAEQSDALPALGQAAWLAVSFPVDPHLTATILDHIVDETPDNSDGAAVAAATAHYVADLRGASLGEKAHAELVLFTGGLLARVARRHGDVTTQAAFDAWVARMELDDPDRFLVRLRNVIDVMVQSDWWFDRNALRESIPA